MNKTFVLTEFGETENHNKFWRIIVDGNIVTTEWGRVGESKQTKSWDKGYAAISFANGKIAEKKAKGYKEGEFIQSEKTVSINADSESLKREISDDPFVRQFVDRITKANVHSVLSQTTLTLNSNGLFQTPLGIVTPTAILEARNLLADAMQIEQSGKSLSRITSDYLMIIPHKTGMKKDLSILDGKDRIQKENDLLDALQSSYDTAMAQVPAESSSVEKKFGIKMRLINGSPEAARIENYYINSRSKHHTDRMRYRIANVYEVQLDHTVYQTGKNVIEVFHGTSERNLLSILINGLKTSPPSTAAIAGKMFGNGIYGAINSTKSLGYTSIGHNESGWLLVCDFVMGNYYHPTQDVSHPPSGYESVWALSGKTRGWNGGLLHDELIVYQNNKAKIKYLIEVR